MARRLHLYMNNPTAGGVDGTEISSTDDTLPLTTVLDASKSEAKALKCAVRCDSGYLIDGDTDIFFTGTNVERWQVAPDDGYTDAETALIMAQWASTLTIAGVSTTNITFWVKASSLSSEDPQNDRSVKLIAEGLTVVGT